MPYNSAATSFAPQQIVPVFQPSIFGPTRTYSGLTTAQCAANGALTSVSVTSSGATVEAATKRTNGITLIVPADQPQVTFGNDPASAANGIVALPNPPVTPITQTVSPPSSNGFAIPPGDSIFISPYNDAVYAVTPAGITATIYFIDT